MASVFQRGGKGRFYVAYFDHTGKRRTIRTKYRVKKDAQTYAAQLERDVENIRRGLLDPKDVELAKHARRPLQEHFKEFLAHLEHDCDSVDHVKIRRSQLNRLADAIGAKCLADVLDPNAIDRYLQQRAGAGKSAATINRDLAAVVAFVNWCVARGRCRSNPLKIIGKLNEDVDRRRERRALTPDELDALLAVARERDALNSGRYAPRFPVYLTAALTGLRRRELTALEWSDVDLQARTITIPAAKGKAKRADVIPLHRQVVETLRAIRPANGRGRVFATIPRIKTVYADLKRAGIDKQDADGRWVDLHALRTTLGTVLARSEVSPAEAQRLMRHGDYRTTLKHYTRLTLRDDSAAIDRLPDVLRAEGAQRMAQRTECDLAQAGRVPGAANQSPAESVDDSKPLTLATLRDAAHTPCGGAQAKQNTAKTRAISSVG